MTQEFSHPSNRAPSAPLHLLAVDDTVENLLLLGELLSDLGEMHMARSGDEALKILEQVVPDLILLDVMMPDPDGFEVCRRIKASPRLRDVPVVFLTALVEDEAEKEGLSLGAIDYIRKPFQPELTRQRILNHLEHARLRRSLTSQNLRLEQQVRERTLSLQIAKEGAESAGRIKGAILRNMNHEFRTPLNGVLGMLNLARENNHDARVSRYLEHALGAGQRLSAVLRNFVDLAVTESGQMHVDRKVFRVGHLLDLIAPDHALAARGKQLTLRFAPVAADLADQPLLGDPVRIGQILDELLGNAIKFSDRGDVTLSIRLANEAAGPRLRFEVSDQGVGIPAQHMDHVFSPFRQADDSETRRHGGNGIGLALCQKLAGLMGGELSVRSQEGQGTCFTLDLPCVPANPEMDEKLPDYESARRQIRERHASARILLADDDRITLDLIGEILLGTGLTVVFAGDGEEALAAARKQDFDLIALDLQMPRQSGLETARALRAMPAYRHTPILAMTARALAEDFERSFAAGIDAHLIKPFSQPVLLQTFLKFLDRARLRETQPQAGGAA